MNKEQQVIVNPVFFYAAYFTALDNYAALTNEKLRNTIKEERTKGVERFKEAMDFCGIKGGFSLMELAGIANAACNLLKNVTEIEAFKQGDYEPNKVDDTCIAGAVLFHMLVSITSEENFDMHQCFDDEPSVDEILQRQRTLMVDFIKSMNSLVKANGLS